VSEAPPQVPADSIAAVVFDFDGTLADTRHAVVTTVQQTLRELGVAQLPAEEIVVRMGLPLAQVFVAAGVAAERCGDAVQWYRQRFPANTDRVALFPGVLAGLRALASAGIPLGIASARGRGSLLPLIDALGIAAYFGHVLGDEDVEQRKPAPDLVLALAQRMQLAPARMLVVGDTTYDVEMGHAAGAHTCAVTYGSHDIVRLRDARPHHVVDSLADLHERFWQVGA
jgi:phosphoglycolate phosphatase